MGAWDRECLGSGDMGVDSINSRLLAQSYDPSGTGYVNLRNDDRALGAPGTRVSVGALAAALQKDQVAISRGVIEVRKPGTVRPAASMQAIAMATRAQRDLGWSNWPSQDYQFVDSNGQPQYAWQGAIEDLRGRLQAIATVASRGNDDTSRSIANRIRASLEQNNWQAWMGNAAPPANCYRPARRRSQFDPNACVQWNAQQRQTAAQNCYQQLYGTLQAISDENPMPVSDTVQQMVDQVNGAQQSLDALGAGLEKAGGQQRLIARTQQTIGQLQAAINKKPGWQNFLNNLPQGDSGYPETPQQTVDRLQQDLQAVQGANPDALRKKLLPLAQSAYGVVQASRNARTPDDAAALTDRAQGPTGDAQLIQQAADNATSAVQDLQNSP